MKRWVMWMYDIGMYLVGYWQRNGNFTPCYQKKTLREAAALVNYLNGGKGKPMDVIFKFKPTKAMWVFQHNLETSVFVGYFLPSGEFKTVYEVATERQAEALVNYLNGGTGEPRQIISDPETEPEPVRK